jgi:ligand-binding sensor domain-containing protein
MWVGYHSSGLVAFRGQDDRVYTTRDGLPSNEIFAIRETHAGDLLIFRFFASSHSYLIS